MHPSERMPATHAERPADPNMSAAYIASDLRVSQEGVLARNPCVGRFRRNRRGGIARLSKSAGPGVPGNAKYAFFQVVGHSRFATVHVDWLRCERRRYTEQR